MNTRYSLVFVFPEQPVKSFEPWPRYPQSKSGQFAASRSLPVPCPSSLPPVPCPHFPVPSSLSPVCCPQFPAPQFAPVPCPQFPAPSSLSQVPCLQFAAPSSLPKFPVLVPCPKFPVPILLPPVPCSPLPCPQFPVSSFLSPFLPPPRLEALHTAVGDQPRLRSTCRP